MFLVGFLANQLAAIYDVRFGLLGGIAAVAIGYFLFMTSDPMSRLWQWAAIGTWRRQLSVIVLAMIATGALGGATTWAFIWQSRNLKPAPPSPPSPTAAEIASEVVRHLPKPHTETVGATDHSDAVVIKANTYPQIEASINDSTAEIFLANRTPAPVNASVRVIPDANKFDQKTMTARPTPPPTIDLGQIAVGDRKRLAKIRLDDEDEEAVFIAADLGKGTNFTRPLVYRVYFRKPAGAWQFEYTLHDSYERRKLLQRAGTPESASDRRRRVRFKLSQLIMHGNMLKQGFEWLCQPTVDEKTHVRIDTTDKLGEMVLDIQAWGAEAVFWTQWELGDSYVARLTTPTQSAQYPRGFEELPHREFYRDSWDRLTAYLAKLEEFLKELPEL